ncbi:hypothetical protein KGM_201385 [Danaus plexippus plexippus]|uniref:Uncharacterized protein n=1 Tax=Danaus plexippus plexippus TaxID=278856 RepID=A0A212FHH3_DANPL|nr:hypothetical protein KGM_201385 [Danaus plexippus plexippus]
MWLWLVVWQATLVVGGTTLDVRLLNSRYTRPQYDCFDYPSALQIRSLDTGWRLSKKWSGLIQTSSPKYSYTALPEFSRRIDLVPLNREDMVKEHAKLVQDINSLRQVMFVAPIADESKDYEDSVFHEILETTSTTTSRPKITKPSRPKTHIPLIVLGGSRTKQPIKSHPKIQKQPINLVGSSTSHLDRHPYPFVMAASARPPLRICMPMTTYTTTRRPSLWERLVKTIIPR